MGKSTLAQQDYGVWRYKNGAFYATKAASIARDLKLPDVASIQFDVAWKGTFSIAVALYATSLQPVSLAAKEKEPDFGGFYSLMLNNYTLNELKVVKKNEPLRLLGQAPIPEFTQKSSAQIEIRVSKPKRIIALLVDGNLAQEWRDTEEFAGEGTAMRFVHQGAGAIKLHNLRISDWDGQLPEKVSTNVPDPKLDLARLRNGDKVGGTVRSIQNGKVQIETSGSKLEIPLNRFNRLEFATEKTERPPMLANSVRAFFVRGQSVTFQLEKWDDSGVVAKSPAFGKVTFKPTAFSKLQFLNPAASLE
jgi:hypothetical protein